MKLLGDLSVHSATMKSCLISEKIEFKVLVRWSNHGRKMFQGGKIREFQPRACSKVLHLKNAFLMFTVRLVRLHVPLFEFFVGFPSARYHPLT